MHIVRQEAFGVEAIYFVGGCEKSIEIGVLFIVAGKSQAFLLYGSCSCPRVRKTPFDERVYLEFRNLVGKMRAINKQSILYR
jgi:hypothetical protein